MYLKSLEIQGFKSFPDKTVLNFNKGITAVVGPNGSGKSNIGDAMRWVMGEQSPKSLRGDKMSGIIFHGTQNRPKASFAQVTITIDNEDRALDFDSNIVSVSRKLYRNGDSEYMINGNGVRLKDVFELFLDTGLGKEGYSIIGQGRIADIVNGKSGERREIFEQAAGISKFRYKKEEAEKKLAAAEDNISRLTDILSELESRIKPLKTQCEKAKKFRELDKEKSALEISLWSFRLDECMKKIKEYEEHLKLLNQQYEALADELEDDENKINEYLQKGAEQSELVEKYRGEIHATELENSKAQSDIAVLENDIAHLEDNILQLKERIEQSHSSKYYLEAEIKNKSGEQENLKKNQEDFLSEIEKKKNILASLSAETEKKEAENAEVSEKINKAYVRKSQLNFKIENAKNVLDELNIKFSESEEDIKRIESEKNLSGSEIKRLEKEKEELSEKLDETQNRLDGMNRLCEVKKQKYQKISQQYRDADVAIREVNGKLKILEDLENSMEGFAYSVKHIMNASKQGRISGIFGSVAQLISVKSEYSPAIETALGGALQNIVVENEESAKRGIKLLKENKAGRATFLPLTSYGGKRMENPSLEKERGFVAIACDLVKCDEKFSSVIAGLLGRICIAENIDFATDIARKYAFKFRIVTLDGQVVNAGGSFSGGSLSKNTGILTRKNQIEELEKKRETLEKNYQELKEQSEKLKVETEKMQAESEGLKENLSVQKAEKVRKEMELERVRDEDKRFSENLEKAQKNKEEIKEKIISAEKETEECTKELSQLEEEIKARENSLADVLNKQSEMKEQREKLSEEISSMKIKSAEISKDYEACVHSIEQLRQSIESSSSDSEKLEEEIENHRKEIENKKEEITGINEKVSGSDEVISGINRKIDAAQKAHLEFENEAAFIRKKIKTKTDEKENLSEQSVRAAERKKSLEEEYDKLASNLWDEYHLTRSDAAEQSEIPEDISKAKTRLAELKGKIKALGNVNLGAIEEFAEVNERYEFMNGQLKDVTTSKKELEELIEELTENMKNIFTQSFDEINKNFKEIFTELFGGGKGELSLTEPDNVLECGIDINVQPPGKVITNLMSLSGGEQALVAVAIYFSILKISPTPFCLLDEIEAALDDVNVARYARYLHRLTDKTQFITITHRRGTMEEADVLYGVTMQEKGISKLLKMTVDETKQMELNN